MAGTAIQKSTTVRFRRVVVRSSFALGEYLAPGLGARVAERIWFTVPPTRRAQPPSGGEPFEARSDGHLVRGRRWGSGPVVYLVHGWGGHAGQLEAFVEPLVGRGFTVVAHDAPSHGASDPGPSGPRSSHAVEFGRALDAVAAVHGPAHAVVAHSMGAMATMLTLRHGWLGAGRLAFVAPLTRLPRFLDEFGATLGFGPRTRRHLDARARRRVGLGVAEFDLERLADPASLPLLVVHDRRDRETPYPDAVDLAESWPGAVLLSTSGLGHRRVLTDPDVVRAVTDFVAAADAGRRLAVPA
jgi:pimeloyl-ACP methyl ester carboxylesterase